MIRGVHAIPSYEESPPKSEERFVACLFGDTIYAVNGGRIGTTTVFRFAEGEPTTTRAFAYEKPAVDPYSPTPQRPIAGVAIDLAPCDGRLWLTRPQGHAEVDPETLDIRPVPRSAVTRVRDMGNGEALVGGFSRGRDGRGSWHLTAVPYAALTSAVVTEPVRVNDAPKVQGREVPFPDLLGSKPSVLERRLEAFEITARAGRALCVARSTWGGPRREIVDLDLGSGNVVAHVDMYEDEELVPVHVKDGVLLFGDRHVLRLNPVTLAVVDRARRPKGLTLVAHDDTRIVLRSTRALVVVDTASLTGPLADAVGQMEKAVAAALRADASVKREASSAAAKSKSKKAALEDPDTLTVRSHEATLREDLFVREKSSAAEVLAKGPPGPYGASMTLDVTRRAARCATSEWPSMIERALAVGVDFYERKVRGDYRAGASYFSELLALAIMRGDAAARASLVALVPAAFDRNEGLPFVASLAHALVAVVQGDDARALAVLSTAETEGTAYASRVRPRTAEYTTLLILPRIPVLRALVAGDAAAHDEALAEAFRKHRKHWGQKRGMNPGDRPLLEDPDGFVAYPLGGCMALARERGMAVKVRSDYAPSFMFSPPLD